MHSHTIDVVTDWETVPTPAGYEGLRRLADTEFSGAASAGTAWAFLLNGRVVGVFEGDIEDFAEADVTAYRAADPSLPLLFAMQERGGETRANYYTNETPLRDVDRTLSGGGFTGYIELSENVLSGDYYVVYHGGKSMSAAFVGSSERLLTGDEAFETAADEVGIYEVINADIDLVGIPDPIDGAGGGGVADAGTAGGGDGTDADDAAGGDGTDADDAAGGDGADDAAGGDGVGADGAAAETGSSDVPAGDPESPGAGVAADARDGDGGAGNDATPAGDADVESAGDPVGGSPEPGTDTDPEPTDPAETGEAADSDAGGDGVEAVTPADGSEPADPATGRDPGSEDAAASAPPTDRDADNDRAATASTPRPETAAESGRSDGSEGSDGDIADERRWQEARTIPSLDPDKSPGSATPDREVADGDTGRERTARMQRQRERRRSERDTEHADATQPSSAVEHRSDAGGTATDGDVDDGIERLRRRLSRARERVESLEAERDELREERAELRDDREELTEERDSLRGERVEQADRIEELEAECDRLHAEVDRLESALDGQGASPAESVSPERALSGTNLFVRYDTKGRATLKHAHAGEVAQDDVRENLRLEHHTTFETDGVVVDDHPYEEFLHDTTEYAFAHWLVSDLLYEIGGTGNRSGLAGVFDAIPDVDRIELHGEVGVETDDGVETRSFDVICRDRMGDPLFVADINPSRDATTEAMVGSLVENTGTVAAEEESVAAGFYVTESFYEPGALETVAERTNGGILSRSKKQSFVKMSRKRGYHLCLVEARDGEFHMNVPEL